MARIVVLRPDEPEPPPAPFVLAPRGRLPERPVVGLVPNGKPFALELLRLLAAELPHSSVELLRKPSAAFSISAEEATAFAARCHVVVTGVGD